MDKPVANTYRFYCEAMELISSGSRSYVKLICRPGSIIVEIPYDKNISLGDRVIITGSLNIITTEKDCNSEPNHIPNN